MIISVVSSFISLMIKCGPQCFMDIGVNLFTPKTDYIQIYEEGRAKLDRGQDSHCSGVLSMIFFMCVSAWVCVHL